MPKDTKPSSPSKPANVTKSSQRAVCTMNACDFADAFHAVDKARGSAFHNQRYSMMEFRWEPMDKTLRLTATDGYRIHRQSVPMLTSGGATTKSIGGKPGVRCVLTERCVRMMLQAISGMRTRKKGQPTVTLTLDQTDDKHTLTLHSTLDEFSFTYSQPVEGSRFPDCDVLLSERKDMLCDVNRMALLKAMRDYAENGYTESYGLDGNSPVPVVISTLTASNTLVYETGWRTKTVQDVWRMPAVRVHSDSRIWLNPQYLIDALTCCKSDVVTLTAGPSHSVVELYDRHNPSSAEHGYKRFVALIAAIRPPEK